LALELKPDFISISFCLQEIGKEKHTFTLLKQEILLKEETVKNYLILDNGSSYYI
jgi:hypothetical protein